MASAGRDVAGNNRDAIAVVTRMIRAVLVAVCLGTSTGASCAQAPVVRETPAEVLSEYAGVYQWAPDAFLYVQLWSELSGSNQLIAFDESGEVRTLYPTDRDRFFAGPAAALRNTAESSIAFTRDSLGGIESLRWARSGAPPRVAKRVDTEKREDIQFHNGDVRLVGTLTSPRNSGRHPTIILVHASGAEDREYLLPFARFLIRHGIAVLG